MKPLLSSQDIPSLIKILPFNTVTTKETNGHAQTRSSQCITRSLPEYLPKRMIKFAPLKNISISAIGSSVLHYENFGPMKEPKDKGNDNDYLEFRTAFILKYAHNADFFYKTKNYVDCIDSQEKKSSMTEYFAKIRKAIEAQSRLLFNINPKHSDAEKNYLHWKQMVMINYELNSSLNKYCDLLFTELQSDKERNLKHLKRIFELEALLQGKESAFAELDNYVNRFDVSNKIKLEKSRAESIESIKEKFTQKENSYLLKVYRLEEEIRDLTSLLDKNKEYYQQFKDCQAVVENKKKEIEDMRVVYNKEISTRVIEIAILKDTEYELKTQVEELEAEKKALTTEVDALKKDTADKQAQIIKMQMIINERTENVNMANEEIETWLLELEDEKNNHDSTTQALIALENRIMKEKEKAKESKKDIEALA